MTLVFHHSHSKVWRSVGAEKNFDQNVACRSMTDEDHSSRWTVGSMLTSDWLRFLFSFEGRVSRKGYLLGFFAPLFLTVIVVGVLVPPPYFSAAVVPVLLASWPSVAIGAKRCHDRNRSGWYQLIALVPFIGWPWL